MRAETTLLCHYNATISTTQVLLAGWPSQTFNLMKTNLETAKTTSLQVMTRCQPPTHLSLAKQNKTPSQEKTPKSWSSQWILLDIAGSRQTRCEVCRIRAAGQPDHDRSTSHHTGTIYSASSIAGNNLTYAWPMTHKQRLQTGHPLKNIHRPGEGSWLCIGSGEKSVPKHSGPASSGWK